MTHGVVQAHLCHGGQSDDGLEPKGENAHTLISQKAHLLELKVEL